MMYLVELLARSGSAGLRLVDRLSAAGVMRTRIVDRKRWQRSRAKATIELPNRLQFPG